MLLKKKGIFRIVLLKDLPRQLSKRNKFYISRITKAKVLPCQSKLWDSNPFKMNVISKTLKKQVSDILKHLFVLKILLLKANFKIKPLVFFQGANIKQAEG